MSDTPRTSSILALILETNGVLNSKIAPQQLVILCRELERELNAANERIKRLEEAGDAMFIRSTRVGREIWTKAKEAHP